MLVQLKTVLTIGVVIAAHGKSPPFGTTSEDEFASCLCSFDGDTLDCAGIGLEVVPQDCFELYPSPTTVILDQNSIYRIEVDDFEAVAGSLIELRIQENPLEFIHRNAFANLIHLEVLYINGSKLQFLHPYLFKDLHGLKYLSLDGPLSSIPKKLFSQSLTNSVTFDLYASEIVVLPCSVLADLPIGSTVNSVAQYRWTTYGEITNCSNVFPATIIISFCSLAGITKPVIDCSTIPQEMTAGTASLSFVETGRIYHVSPNLIVFPAYLERLAGDIPPHHDCLPNDMDKVWDFQVYFQHTEDLILETYYFDLSNLYLFTSSYTKSVTIKADTVVLSQNIPPLAFPLNIYARQVVLEAPLYSLANLDEVPPRNNPEFYQFHHQVGEINGVAVESFQHGFINIEVLQSSACLPPDAPDFSNKFATVISPLSLELSLYCGNTLLEGDTFQQEAALEIASWIKNITKEENDPEIYSINQLAHALSTKGRTSQRNDTLMNFVPYITLAVYKPMLDALKENLNLFRSIQIQLQDKLERNANRLFDMTISFEERKADLQFISDQSDRALEEAKNVLGTQVQKLSDLRLQTDGVYNTIFLINEHFVSSYAHMEVSHNKLQESIQHKLDNMFLRRCGAFFKGFVGIFVGVAGPGDVVEGVNGVGDYKRELEEAKEVLTESMLKINELMEDVEKVVEKLQDIPTPPSGQSHNWTAIFPDNAPLLALVQMQSVTKYEWDIVNDNNNILLNDEDLQKLSGTADFQMDSVLMKTDGQDLSNNMISFSKLILDIRDEEENLKIANLAVAQGGDHLKEVSDMLSDTETNEENYKDKIIQQNLVIMKLMLNLYQKTRKDMTFIMGLLNEYCQAYFYTFFTECPEELLPNPFNSFEELLYKINQLEFDSLNSIGTLDPPPQPFSKTFLVSDRDTNCTTGVTECPVTTLKQKGEVNIDLSKWWGDDLLDKDRVRVDKVRFYLKDTGNDFVILLVTPPTLFNDTYEGQEHSFVGHSSQCLIIYEDYSHTDMASAFYQTDCSTHQTYDQFYSRTTPFGSYILKVTEEGVGNLTTAIEVMIEGAWIPRVDFDDQIEGSIFENEACSANHGSIFNC